MNKFKIYHEQTWPSGRMTYVEHADMTQKELHALLGAHLQDASRVACFDMCEWHFDSPTTLADGSNAYFTDIIKAEFIERDVP